MGAFSDGQISITDTDVVVGQASYRLGAITGVSVAQEQGSLGARWLGLLCVFIALAYGGCASCADAMTGDNGGKITALAVFGFGAAAFGYGAWWARGDHVVSVKLGGQDVALAAYPQSDAAMGAAEEVRKAVNLFATRRG